MARTLGLTIAPAAKRDIREEGLFLELNGSAEIADRFVESVLHTGRLLCGSAQMGTIFRASKDGRRELRSFPVSGAYGQRLIVYSVGVRSLRIERVVHGARDLARIFS
jgi:plasmid stabilization system protein ParE